MLPKRYRLIRSNDFGRARRCGRSSGSQLVVLYVRATRMSEVRVGFSVSKRVGKAVVRNRVRRRMREAVRHYLPAIKSGHDLVFIARPAAAEASYDQIAGAVAHLLRKSAARTDPIVAADA